MVNILVSLAVLALTGLVAWRCLRAAGLGPACPSPFTIPTPLPRIFLWALVFRLGLLLAGVAGAMLLSQGELSLEGAFRQLQRWDAVHYQNLVELGYGGYVEDGQHLFLVFYPGYVWAVRLVSLLVPDTQLAGTLVSVLCAAGGACAVYRLGEEFLGPGPARDAVMYLCLFPFSFFAGYMWTEGLFLLLTAGACLCARRGKWLLFALLGAGAALTRMTGLLVIAVAVVELLGQKRPLAPGQGKPWPWALKRLPLALAPLLGACGYLALNWRVDGDPFAFVRHQGHWYQGYQWIGQVAAYMGKYFCQYAGQSFGWAVWLPSLGLFAAGLALLFWAALKNALPASLLCYGALYFVATFSLSWLLSAGRYLSCCFPLFLAAAALTARRPWARGALLGGQALFLGLYLAAFLSGAQVM